MRPPGHRVGDVGLNSVEAVFLDAGWVVNRIVSDYGEDLSAQPVTAGIVEKSRIYIQVKSVSSSSNRRVVTLRRDDLFVWQFSREMFLLVVWLVEQKRAAYVWINEQNNFQLYAKGQAKTVTFDVRKLMPLDAAAIAFLHAECRNRFYRTLLSEISRYIERADGYKRNKRAPNVLKAKQAATKVACRMLVDADIFRRDGDSFSASKNFFLAHFQALYETGLAKRIRMGSSLDWAIVIVDYAWQLKYKHLPSTPLAWALVNATSIVITSHASFKFIVREFSKQAKGGRNSKNRRRH